MEDKNINQIVEDIAKAWETYVTARNMEYRLKGDEA